MLKIHVFNVNLGDSIILETEVQGECFYSLIDCKSVEGRAPTVEYLRQNSIRHIQSLFLTHLHNDHCSGFPQLLDYLLNVNGTLEYFVSPQLPAEIEIWGQIIAMAHDQTTRTQLTETLKAMNGFLSLPSRVYPGTKTMAVRIVYEGGKSTLSWHDHLHPALLFAPVNPSPQEAFQFVQSAFRNAQLQNKAVNALSHALLIRYDHGSRQHIGLLTGDLDGKSWRFVKNRCLEITGNSIRNRLTFLKVPHHGAFSQTALDCLKQLVAPGKDFLASISCPPGDPTHPNVKTLDFLKTEFNGCCIACTNISGPCHTHGYPSVVEDLLEQPPKEAEFLEFASGQHPRSLPTSTPGACAGDHVLTISGNDCHLLRSTGLPCSFNPEGCRNFDHSSISSSE